MMPSFLETLLNLVSLSPLIVYIRVWTFLFFYPLIAWSHP